MPDTTDAGADVGAMDDVNEDLMVLRNAQPDQPAAETSTPVPAKVQAQASAQPAPPANQPPTWQQVQALPQFQQANAQQKQDAFTKWIGVSHQFSAEQGYNPDDSAKTAISEWTAKQARDLGMASFTDPNSGQSIPINTGMVSDYGTRVEKFIGQLTGNSIQGVAHASRYVNTAVWVDQILDPLQKALMPADKYAAMKAAEPDITEGVEKEGAYLANQAENIAKPNPLYDNTVEAKAANFIGSLLPVIASGPLAPITGGGMMGQQFKNDAADAGLDSTQQEEAFGGGAIVGGVMQKLAGVAPWLREADSGQAMKDALTQTTSATLLKSFVVNSIRGGIESAGQTAAEQVALHQDPTSPESLHQDLDAGLTFAIGGGLLGAGFKALGVIPAKAAIQTQFEAENQIRQDNGQEPISMPDYVAQRIAEVGAPKPPPIPAKGNGPVASPEAASDPLDAYNDELKTQVDAPLSTEAPKDEVQGTHPVFGEGTYPAHAMLGTMATTDVADGTQQLSWNDQPTAQVRRLDENGNWQYGEATPEEAAMPAFQQPTLTKDGLINSKPPVEASINPAEVQAAQAVGPATTKALYDEKENDPAEKQSSESQPVLDQAGLGNDGGRSVGAGGRQDVEDAASPNGQGNDARSHEGDGPLAATGEGGSARAPALPPRSYDDYQKQIDDFMDQQEASGMTSEQVVKQWNPNEGKKPSDFPPDWKPMPQKLADLYDARDNAYKQEADGQRDAIHAETSPIVGEKTSNDLLGELGLNESKNGGEQAYFQSKIGKRLQDITSSLGNVYNKIVHDRTNDDIGTGRFYWSGTGKTPTITFEGKGRLRSKDVQDAVKFINVIREKIGKAKINEKLFEKGQPVLEDETQASSKSKSIPESKPIDPNDFTPVSEEGKTNEGIQKQGAGEVPAKETVGQEVGAGAGEETSAKVEPGTVPGGVEAPEALKAKVDASLQRQGIKGVQVVYSKDESHPAWADPAQPGKIFVNPDAMAESFGRLGGEKASDEWLGRVAQEEVVHDAQHSVEADWKSEGTHSDNVDKIFNEVSPKERKKTIARYGNDSIDPSKGTTPEDIAKRKALFIREHARQILQRKLNGETTEDVWLSGKKPALIRYFSSLYNKLKARVASSGSSHLGAYLRATEGVLEDAKRNGQDVSEKTGASMPPDSKAFKDWFGESKMVDEDGNPQVFYHGTHEKFNTFDMSKAGDSTGGFLPVRAMFFSRNPEHDSHLPVGTKSKEVMPVYLSIKNPLFVDKWSDLEKELGEDTDGFPDRGLELLKENGYDGVVSSHGDEVMAIYPTQIKSATGNRGTFDPKDSDITHASMPPLPAKAKAMLDVGDKLQKELRADMPARYALDRTRAKRQLSAEQQRSSQQVKKIVTSFNKAIPDPVRRDAVTIYREAGGDAATLKQWENGTKDPALKKAYEAAQNLTPEEKAWADKITQTYDLTRKRLIQMGVDVAEISNYANHVWRDSAGDRLKRATSKNLKTAFQYAKQRKIPSYFAGEQLGLEPETKDAGKLLGGYILDANRVISSRNFIANLSKGKEADGRPIVAPKFGGFTHIDKGADGKIHLVFNGKTPEEYSDYRDDLKIPALSNWNWKGTFDGTTVMGRSDMAIHPNAHSDLKNIFGRSQLREWWDSPSDSVAGQVAKSATKFLLDDLNSYGKTTLFGGLPFFHAVQETMEGASHLSLPSKSSEYWKEPDLSDPAMMDKAEHGLMLAPDRSSQALFEDGMDSAHRNLLIKLAKHIPGIGPKIQQAVDFGQDWLFESYIPSLKSKMYDTALARNQQRFSKELAGGKITLDQVKYLTADQTNNAFGHLNYTDIARNPLMQHMMQMAILAPDFTEARIRHAGQAASGLIGNKGGREQTMAMVGMAAAIFLTARVLNASLNNGDPKWDEPFSVINGNRRYGVRFAGGDLMELFRNWRGWVGGRESPISRAAMELFTGVNYRGEKVSTGDAFKDALAGNMPMYLQPMLRDISPNTKNNPVSPLEQFMGSIGMKVSRYSPISQVYPLADAWKAKYGPEYGLRPDAGVYPTSQYTPLKYALDDGNLDQAWTEYQKLVKAENGNAQRVASGTVKSINASYTGSPKTDAVFYESLDPDQKKLFDAAVARRVVLQDRFAAMFQQFQK